MSDPKSRRSVRVTKEDLERLLKRPDVVARPLEHCSDHELVSYSMNLTPPHARPRIEGHLAGCGECGRILRRLTSAHIGPNIYRLLPASSVFYERKASAQHLPAASAQPGPTSGRTPDGNICWASAAQPETGDFTIWLSSSVLKLGDRVRLRGGDLTREIVFDEQAREDQVSGSTVISDDDRRKAMPEGAWLELEVIVP